MSYNPNFYNNFPRNTFQSFYSPNIPPPPLPPPFFIPSTPPVNVTDQDFVKGFENQIKPVDEMCKIKSETISTVKQQLSLMLAQLNQIQAKHRSLRENLESLCDDEWNHNMKEVGCIKIQIANSLAHINDNYLDVIKRLIAKRSAKRLRLKRLRMERKREKEEWIKKLQEKSRKIDENLQKIKDDYQMAKQAKESKLKADIVLKEVLRKKHDTKKNITKLEMLVKLRKARENTARGRGESVSERDREDFGNKIEKLKQIWLKRQAMYDKEENLLRDELKTNSDTKETANEVERVVERNLGKWRRVMFGSSRGSPQVEFSNVEKFVAVRSKWDQFLNAEGTSIPVGWVTPSTTSWKLE